MSKNKGLGLISALAVGAGVAAVAAGKKYKTVETKKKEDYDALHNTSEYRNTERGKYEKNSKGIYYTNGNYEAFARPRKPEGVDDKHAYIVGSGLASLAAACFLVRDGQMPGKNIHILEAMDIAGGACDGIFDPSRGYVMRGGREMENHFECLWDLFRSIPSIETPGVSVLDEYYWLNKEDPNYSLCRATKERGKDAHTDGKFNLSTVVTHKTSDWSVISLDKPVPYIWIKAVRRLDAVEIFYSFDDKTYTMMRNAWLQDNIPVKVGFMAACPDGNGFNAKFEHFEVKHLPDMRRLEWLKKNAE